MTQENSKQLNEAFDLLSKHNESLTKINPVGTKVVFHKVEVIPVNKDSGIITLSKDPKRLKYTDNPYMGIVIGAGSEANASTGIKTGDIIYFKPTNLNIEDLSSCGIVVDGVVLFVIDYRDIVCTVTP